MFYRSCMTGKVKSFHCGLTLPPSPLFLLQFVSRPLPSSLSPLSAILPSPFLPSLSPSFSFLSLPHPTSPLLSLSPSHPSLSLQVLWLRGNPLSSAPEYRSRVAQLLPHLTQLDNVCELLHTQVNRASFPSYWCLSFLQW